MRPTCLAASLLLATSTIVLAQTVGGGGASIVLPEVVVNRDTPFDPYNGKYQGAIGETSSVAGVDKSVVEIPRSVYVVTPQTLAQQMPQSLAEALQTVPGTFIGNTNGGNSDYITIKGFEADANDFNIIGNGNGILVDFIRAPFDRVFNANTQSVELLSGPAALLYGNANVGGVIEVNRKLPLPETHYSVGLLGGAVGGKFRDVAGSFDITGPIFKSTEAVFAYRLVGSAARDEPWRKGDTVSRDFLLAPTLAMYSDTIRATLAFEHNRNQQPYDRGDTSTGYALPNGGFQATGPLNISRYISYSEPFSTFDENLNWIHSEINYHPVKDIDINLRSSYSDTKIHYDEVRSDNQTDFNPATGAINRYVYSDGPQGSDTQQYFFWGDAVRRFDLGPIKDEFLAGADYYNFLQQEPNLTFNYYGANQPFNLYNPIYGTVPNGSGQFLDFANIFGLNGSPLTKQKQRELGVFFQNTATYDRFTLIGGGRWTQIKSYENSFETTQTNSTEHAFLPSAQALYAFTPSTSAYASYSQAFQPNIYALGVGTLTFVGPNLPQRGAGYEVGLKSKFLDGRILAQASVFRIDKENVQNANPVTNAISFTQSQRSEGAQLSVVGNVTPSLQINVAYSHQNVVVTDDIAANNDIGKQVVNAPQNTFAVYAYYHFLDGPLNHLTLNAGVFGADKNAVDSINTYFLPAFAVFSTGFSYEYKKRPTDPLYTLSFKINNIADTRYFPSTGSKTNWLTVGEPRNFLLGLSMSL